MSNAASDQPQGAGSAPQTRHRKITACLRCRDRKKKCDRGTPICENCRKEKKECIYANDGQQLREHKQQMHNLKRTFAHKLASGERAQDNPELNPLIVVDPAYEEDADDDSGDVGIRCGKLRISDRIGGFVRPRMVEELTTILHTSSMKSPRVELGSEYRRSSEDLSPAEFLDPGPSYLAPSSISFWPPKSSNNQATLLLNHSQGQVLLQRYWVSVHPIARVLHRQSFESRWEAYWQTLYNKDEVPKSLKAIVTAVMFSSMISLPEEVILQVMGASKQSWIENLKSEAESALSEANWIRTTKIETLQALVIYLIPLCRAEVSRAHSNIVAAAIRSAEGMGLQLDGTTRGFSPLQTHIRRLIWYQLSVLDIRTCEATGPRPLMRSEDFDTQLPVNLNDVDIENETEDSYSWTEMTVPIIRFKCNEFIRQIWVERRLLQLKRMTVTDVLLGIETFHNEMDRKYGSHANQKLDIQRYGVLLYKLQILRTFAMVLHQYHLHPHIDMSDRLKHVFIVKGIETMETVIDIETDPGLKHWQWLSGALQQHHYALALLMELLLNPQRKDAPRMMRGLDYAFEPPSNLAPLDRVRWTVTRIRDRMKLYVEARKIRAPLDFMEKLRLGKDGSEASENRTSSDRQITPESMTSANSSRSSNPPQDMVLTQGAEGTFSSSSVIRGAAGPIQLPVISDKDIMDVDWEAVAHLYPSISAELDMSSEQFNSALSTGAYPPQISHYNQMPARNEYAQGYNYYSSVSSVASVDTAQEQYYSASTIPQYQQADSYSTNSSQYSPLDASQFAAVNANDPRLVYRSNSTTAPNNQALGSSFPHQTDNEQNFGMGLYRPINTEPMPRQQ